MNYPRPCSLITDSSGITFHLRVERLQQTHDLKGCLDVLQITLETDIQDTACGQGDFIIMRLHHDELNHVLLYEDWLLVPVHVPQDADDFHGL